MAFIQFHHYSASLGMQMEAWVVMPQKKNDGEIGVEKKSDGQKYKCLWLLHGKSDDQTIWLRRTSIERYADKYGICVVMPNAHKSFYTNMKYGHRFYDYISAELPALIHEFFNVSDKREDKYAAGLSMGGYGALKLALRNPDRYVMAAGLSACADIAERTLSAAMDRDYYLVFGDEGVSPEDDLLQLTDAHRNDPVKPELYIGCGLEDFLYEGNLRFREKLDENRYPYVWRESHGTHNWEFWDEYIQYVLSWMFDRNAD